MKWQGSVDVKAVGTEVTNAMGNPDNRMGSAHRSGRKEVLACHVGYPVSRNSFH